MKIEQPTFYGSKTTYEKDETAAQTAKTTKKRENTPSKVGQDGKRATPFFSDFWWPFVFVFPVFFPPRSSLTRVVQLAHGTLLCN